MKTWHISRSTGILAILIAVALVLAACGANGSNEVEEGAASEEDITIGYFPNLDHAAGIVGKNEGYFADHLEGKNVDFRDFPNGNDFIQALNLGEIEMGYVGPGPAINYFLTGGDVVILSAAANGATLIVAREGSGIESLEDFGGKSFCTPGNGCTHNVQLEIMLKDIGLKTDRVGGEVEHVSRVNPASTLLQFETGEIDATAAPEPWGTYLVEELGAKVVTEWDDVFLGETLPSVVFVTTREYWEENPEIIENAVRAHHQSVQFATQNVPEILEIVNQEIYDLTQTELPMNVLEKAWERMVISAKTYPEALQEWADASYALQFIDEEPNLEGFVDTSIIDEIMSGAQG